jgi:uncharacterized protein (DUF885 family)
MTSEHYLREIAELLKEMNQRLARIEAGLGAFPKLTFSTGPDIRTAEALARIK